MQGDSPEACFTFSQPFPAQVHCMLGMSQKCSGGAVALWDDTSLRARAVLKGSAVKEHTRQEVQSAFRGPEQSKEQGAETSGSESFQDCEPPGKLWAGA